MCTQNDFESTMSGERNRLTFVGLRDGAQGLRDFMLQTYEVYSKAINNQKRGFANSREHQYKFIASMVVIEEELSDEDRSALEEKYETVPIM